MTNTYTPADRLTISGRLRCLVVLAGITLAACSSTTTTVESRDAPASSDPDGGGQAAADDEGTKVEFDPANFVDPTLNTNLYYPLTPGTQWVYGGTTLVGDREVPHEVIVTVTDVIRVIDGVPAIAMLSESTDSGEIAQIGMDYMGLDKDGNVWILGGYGEDYEGGEYTNTEGAWLGSVGEEEMGILVPGEVTIDTPRWFIGGAADEPPSIGEPVEVDASVCVAFDCYDNVHIIQEGEVGAPDNENKYYAPGVGMVNNVPLDASLHQDRFELLNLLVLTPEGIDEVSQTVLDLEAHARETAPSVFGVAPEAMRANG